MSAETPVEFLIPFAGTAVGSASAYFMKNGLNRSLSRGMEGFAAGVMTAASVWSLLISSMERSAAWGHRAFVPAAVVFWLGVFFLLALDHAVPHLHMFSEKPEGGRRELPRTTMLAPAVTLHNVPEGMAVGTVYAAFASWDGLPARRRLCRWGSPCRIFPKAPLVPCLCDPGAFLPIEPLRQAFFPARLSLWRSSDLLGGRRRGSSAALFSGFRGGSHGLCGGGRAYSRDVVGRTFIPMRACCPICWAFRS